MQPIDNQRIAEIIVKMTNTQAPAGVFLREKLKMFFLNVIDSPSSSGRPTYFAYRGELSEDIFFNPGTMT
jgi:hypothetical protein